MWRVVNIENDNNLDIYLYEEQEFFKNIGQEIEVKCQMYTIISLDYTSKTVFVCPIGCSSNYAWEFI